MVVLPLVLLGLLRSGFFAPVLESEAVAALERVLPEDLGAEIGEAKVGFNGLDGIGVSVDGFALKDEKTGGDLLRVDRTRIGVGTMSVLRGAPEVRGLRLDGVELHVPNLGGGQGGLPPIAAIEPVLSALFDATNRLFERTTVDGAGLDVQINDMQLFGPGGPEGGILVRKALILARPGERAVEAEIDGGDGKTVNLAAILRRTQSNALTITLTANDVPLPIGRLRTLFSAVEADHQPDARPDPVRASISIAARRVPGDTPDVLSFTIEPTDLSLKLDENDLVGLSGRLSFAWSPQTRVLSLKNSPVSFGRSRAVLSGGLRDARAVGSAPSHPGYEFELIANNGLSDPIDSPELPVEFAARAQGVWTPEPNRAEFSNIQITSPSGNAEGAGTLDFAADVPNAIFALSLDDFALAGVKQFWPASVARVARRWVLSNLAGGRVTEGQFLIAEPLRRRIEGSDERLQGDTELSLKVDGVRFDVTGEIPPVRDAKGEVRYKGGEATITLDSGTAYLPSGRTAAASNGTLVIHAQQPDGLVMADLDVDVAGNADALGELISFKPISAQNFRPYEPKELSGDVDAHVKMRFALNPSETTPPPDWNVLLKVRDAAVSTPFEGRMLSDMTGSIEIDRQHADINVNGRIDGMPADIAMVLPFGDVPVLPSRDITLKLSDAERSKIAPGLDELVSGVTAVKVSQSGPTGVMAVDADLSDAQLALPWVGWAKGRGIAAKTAFDLLLTDKETRISNFRLDGKSFSAAGDITVSPAGLQQARLGKVKLNASDDISVSVDRKGSGFVINVSGSSLDARALIRHVREEMASNAEADGVPVDLVAEVAKVTGFGDETLRKVKVQMRHDGKDLTSLAVTGTTASGFPVSFTLEGVGSKRKVRLEALDGGELLRFLDIYGQVRGGVLTMSLTGEGPDRMVGKVDLNDFRIFNEPRLNALVSSKSGNSASLNEAIQQNIDTREVKFDRASAGIAISSQSLDVANAIVRGPLVGATFRGTVYDRNNQMRLAGTFMPAYAVNSLLSNIPIVGLVLGNGRDRGLIGVTFLLEGDAKKPRITVNPLSAIAPGVFRSIFEFR